LVNPDNPTAERIVKDVPRRRTRWGYGPLVLTASERSDIDSHLLPFAHRQTRCTARPSGPLFNNSRKLVALALGKRCPRCRSAISAIRWSHQLLRSAVEQYRQSGIYVGRILKEKNRPTCRSCSRPVRFGDQSQYCEALGLAVPDKLLALADE